MMKRLPVAVGMATLLLGSVVMAADIKMTDDKQKASYTIGIQLGSQLIVSKDDLDIDLIMMGLKDAFAGIEPRISQEEMQQAIQVYTKNKQKREQKLMAEYAKTNLTEGQAFLAENKTKPGVVTLPSGLQYKVLKAGTGVTPKLTDTVVTHYEGTLMNGQVFDSSYQRGEPVSFPISGVIKGWTEALQKMKVGAKWQLFIPSDLAYGERGGGGKIGPNQTLIFDVELLEIKK